MQQDSLDQVDVWVAQGNRIVSGDGVRTLCNCADDATARWLAEKLNVGTGVEALLAKLQQQESPI